MDFGFSEEEERFRSEVQTFLDKEVTQELRQEIRTGQGWGPLTWDLVRKLGAKGWLKPEWPEQYGGLGLSHVHTFIVCEELAKRGASPGAEPGTHSGKNYVGPTILVYGSEEQKNYFLPRIARGEIETSLGYSEPQAGSDIASVALRATEEDGDYVLNGQKMFPTAAHYAQYIFTLARTDPNLPKHKGLSLFIIDLQSPGIEVRPLQFMGVHRANEVFFDNVRVPKSNLLGEKNRGWYYLMAALNIERIALSPIGWLERVFNELVEYVKQTSYDGKPLAKDPLIRHKLAQMAIEIEAVRVIRYRLVWMLNEDMTPTYEASMLKVFHAETAQRLFQAGMEILGLYGQLAPGSKWAPLQGELERLYRGKALHTIGGGTTEIEKNIIATRGLGLPRKD